MKRFSFLFFGFFLFFGCEIGMGKALDLEAPELTISKPTNFSYSNLQIHLEGTCKDNVKVESVRISNKETGKFFGNALITENNWSFDIILNKEDEGELTLLCEAIDSVNNTSTRSARTLTLLVDETAPEAKSWSIEKNSTLNELYTKDYYENLNLSLSKNKDYPQNEKFILCGNFYDAMNVDYIELQLYEINEDGTLASNPSITKKIKSSPELIIEGDYIGEGKSIYSPRFELTHEDFVKANPKFATGKHYFRIKYIACDNCGGVGNKNIHEDPVDVGKDIFWYPESDNPGFEILNIEDNKISVTVGSNCSVSFFDDDGLESIKYKLGDNSEVQKAVNGVTDYSCSISVGKDPAQLTLSVSATDKNNKVSSKNIVVEVKDQSKPLLIIEEPVENSIPAIKSGTDSTFVISGYSLDTKGCNYVKIVYVPDSAVSSGKTHESIAKDLLEIHKSTAPITNYDNKCFILYKELDSAATDQSGWKRQNFDFEIDLKQNFGENAVKDKYFYFLLVDSDKNEVNRTFKVSGDNQPPKIIINSPEKDFAIIDYTSEDLEIEFKAEKESGLKIDKTSYAVKCGSESLELTQNGEWYKTTIDKTKLANLAASSPQQAIVFKAKDILGNEASVTRNVILNPCPVIKAITIDKNNGTYKIGDVLTFTVSFSKQVKVSGMPELVLKFSDNTDLKYATYDYDSGSGSNSLRFKYIVEEGDNSDGIICNGFKIDEEDVLADGAVIQATELGEGNIKTSLTSAENLEGKIIKLDGTKPYIKDAKFTSPDGVYKDGIYYCNKDKEIEVEVTMSEPVLFAGETKGIKVGNLDFDFLDLNGEKLKFKYKVKGSDGTFDVNYDYSKFFNSESVLKDMCGNELKKAASSSHTSPVKIDTVKPEKLEVKNLQNGKKYNSSQKLEISSPEEGATVYYSLNGGVSFTEYKNEVTLKSGESGESGVYNIFVYQKDIAGNSSDPSDKVSIEIDDNFPKITNVSINVPDGTYISDDKIPIQIDFDKKIKFDSSGVKLYFKDKDGKVYKTADYVVSDDTESSVDTKNGVTQLNFEYQVKENDNFTGIELTKIAKDAGASVFTDEFGTSKNEITISNYSRPDIVIDAIRPTVSKKDSSPTLSGGISNITDNSKFEITLKFSEPVKPNNGEIKIIRKGDWAIPAYFEQDEFLKYYNKMTAENKVNMMHVTDGKETFHSKTGIAVGPYRKITHGLKEEGGTYVPDEETKYVLAYEIGLYKNEDVTLDTNIKGNAKSIRDALKSVDFDKHKVDVASVSVTVNDANSEGYGKSVKIKFTEKIPDGREWYLEIPEGAFIDVAGNKNDEIKEEDDYHFWTNNVATPVIRVDRYTHGFGAKEPKFDINNQIAYQEITKDNGKYQTQLTANSAAALPPTGYCRFRIDCETPGATINYDVLAYDGSKANCGVEKFEDDSKGKPYSDAKDNNDDTNLHDNFRLTIDDISKDKLILSVSPKTYSSDKPHILVGDGSYETARKDYVVAQATLNNYLPSVFGYEGIFKTIACIEHNSNNGYINMEGGTAPGGKPNVDGFPLRDATDENDRSDAGRYSKNCYHVEEENKNRYFFLSYEIISEDWAMLLCRRNHSKDYPLNSYGGSAWVKKQEYY